MLSVKDLTSTARARLADAKALLSKGRFDGASYVCGYAVEIALKARIVKTLKWPGFPSENKEFAGLQSFKTHDLEMLLYLSGWQARITSRLPSEWAKVCEWSPEERYSPPGGVSRADAEFMTASCTKIVRKLL
jgi:HEPN domain-containing protein